MTRLSETEGKAAVRPANEKADNELRGSRGRLSERRGVITPASLNWRVGWGGGGAVHAAAQTWPASRAAVWQRGTSTTL